MLRLSHSKHFNESTSVVSLAMIGFVPTPVLRPSREADCPHHHAAVCSAAPAAPNARTAVLAAAVGAAVISCGFVQPAR